MMALTVQQPFSTRPKSGHGLRRGEGPSPREQLTNVRRVRVKEGEEAGAEDFRSRI
jgi:hypothetical protein